MLKDYIANGEQIKDIDYFLQDKSTDLFLKYFIKHTYSQYADNTDGEHGKNGAKTARDNKMSKSKSIGKDK